MKFLKGKRFLNSILIINIAFLLFWGVAYLGKSFVPLKIVIKLPLLSILFCIAWYSDKISTWYRTHYAKKFKRAITVVANTFTLIIPLIIFCVSYEFSKLFFENQLSTIEITIYWCLIAIHFFFVGHYCMDLKKTIQQKHSSAYKAQFFLVCIIHIAQLFAHICILIFVMFPNSFTGIDTSSAFSIGFDFTYFSLMTLLTAGCEIVAASRLAKSIVLIETFLFVIVISMLIFGLFSEDSNN